MSDKLQVKGTFKLVLKGPDGKIKEVREGNNLVTDVGLALIMDLLDSNITVDQPSHVAIGTSNTAAAAGQTALVGTELARVAAVVTNGATTLVCAGTFGAGVGTGTIEEAGVFNDATVGTMLARFVTGTVTKGAGDSLVVTWTLTIARA